MWNTRVDEAQAGIKIARRNINNLRYTDDTTLIAESKLPTSIGSLKKQEFQKNIYFCFIDYTKAFDCVDHNKLGKFLKEWEYQTTIPASWEIWLQVKNQKLEWDMEQQTGSKSGKKYVRSVYYHPAYLVLCRVHHVKYQGGWSTSWNQDCQEKYQ